MAWLVKYKWHCLTVVLFYVSCFNIFLMYINKINIKIIEIGIQKVSNNKSKFDNKLFDIQGKYIFGNTRYQDTVLFPHELNSKVSDRIVDQMRYIPMNYNKSSERLIFVEDDYPVDIQISMCPVNKCTYTFDRYYAFSADVVLLRSFTMPFVRFKPHQIISVYVLESPQNFNFFKNTNVLKVLNWTATYHFDATIVTPYYKFTPYDMTRPIPERYPLPKEDFSSNRNKQIAWFVSNCKAKNNRGGLAEVLSKYFQVDIYGSCGPLNCPRSHECFQMLRNYMFYLSFENSNCRHYITEKFYLNALNSSVIPIVMGAHPDDYKLVAPPHSYIHVEDFPTEIKLVNYLNYLIKNKTAYNEYFAWKDHGNLDTNTFFWCRLCTMAHYAKDKKMPDASHMRHWWNTSNICRTRTWTITPYW